MTLPLPKLDARSYDQLLQEALRRIPRYTPEYTDHNTSDPGMALIGVNAWLTETLLYQINRVPEQNYVAFLNLLGIKPRPARAASTELSFALKPLKSPSDPLTVVLPAATRVAVDDPALETEVVFETGGSVIAHNAAFGMVLVPDAADAGVWAPVTSFDTDAGQTTWLHAFHPFSESEAAGKQFIMAVVLRPVIDGTYDQYSEDRLPSGAFDVYVEATQVFEEDQSGTALSGPLSQVAGPVGAAPGTPGAVTWEIFTGSEGASLGLGSGAGWQPLGTSHDDTDGLRRSGHLTFEVPSNATPVRFDKLAPSQWDALRLNKPPQTAAEFIAVLGGAEVDLGDQLRAALTTEALELMGLRAPDDDVLMNEVLNVCQTGAEAAAKLQAHVDGGGTLRPSAIPPAEWPLLFEAVADHFAGPEVPTAQLSATIEQTVHRRMYFIRGTLDQADDAPRMLNALRLNTVGAVAASTRQDEKLGNSNGRPGQRFNLLKTPVYFDPLTTQPDIELEVISDGVPQPWTRVDDFYGAGPDAQVYTLNPGTGEIVFGDGRPRGQGGAIPAPNATILVRRYRFGGGALANVGAGSISKVKGSIKHVEGVSNLRAASGGAPEESLPEVLARAPSTLRSQDRAVSSADFAELARQTPEAAIHKAYALAATAVVPDGPDGGKTFAPRAGAVSVVVLPATDHPTPQPTEADLRAVQSWLEPRRLVTTEVFVTGPQYFTISSLAAELRLVSTADFQTVSRAARTALVDWLHPVRGGSDGTGWPFGSDIYLGDVYDLLLSVPGVRRVAKLGIQFPGSDENAAPDVIGIPPGFLPALAEGAINFAMVYDNA